MEKIIIKFKDKNLKTKDAYTILDLQNEIERTIMVFSMAEAINSENELDKFMRKYEIKRDDHEFNKWFGRKIQVESISHNSPTILTIIVSYKVAEMILSYYRNDSPTLNIENLGKGNNVQSKLLRDFITSLEMLREIIEEIIEG
jgi:hypothetical protein